MRKIVFLFVILLSTSLFAQNKHAVIPTPYSVVKQDGTFTLDEGIKYVQLMDDEGLSRMIRNSIYTVVSNKFSAKGEKIFLVGINPQTVKEQDGYKLNISENAIKLTGNNKNGILNGFQTFLQLLPAIRTNEVIKIPCMEIYDYPKFSWRGLHLDVSRHFFSPEAIKQYIDLMAMYKLNVFHWHLTDDQGWRIEIKKYPRLTDVGAWRVDRLSKTWSNRAPANSGEQATYGGYYTQEQIKDIVTYATQRGITIVPEIDVPGHSSAAIAAFPSLSCIQQPQTVITGGQYPKEFQTSLCVGNDSVLRFVENVFAEVMSLFPSKYIHIGGDEVDKSFWYKCPKCQNRMKQENLKSLEELQSYFINRVEKFVNSKGRQIIGWDEILEGGLAPQAAVMSWRGEAGGIAAAKMKHKVVMTPGSPLYFDHYQAGPEGEPLAFGGFNSLQKVYEYNPIPKELSEQEGKYVLGAQANVWTEFISSVSHLQYMILPRIAALAETVWTPIEKKSFIDFSKRINKHFRMYDQKGWSYSKGNFTVNIVPKIINGKLGIILSNEIPNSEIRYTTDGTYPALNSSKFEQPIEINNSTTVKAITVQDGKVMNLIPAIQNFDMHLAVGSNVNYTFPISNSYKANGNNSLADGIRGTNAINKYWHGIEGKNLIATIELAESVAIRKIAIGCLQSYRDWIFLPTSVTFETSNDGKIFQTVGVVKNDVSTDTPTVIKDFAISFDSVKAKFIRVTAQTLPTAPKGHPGEGKPVWIFADEIIVR